MVAFVLLCELLCSFPQGIWQLAFLVGTGYTPVSKLRFNLLKG